MKKAVREKNLIRKMKLKLLSYCCKKTKRSNGSNSVMLAEMILHQYEEAELKIHYGIIFQNN
ncbi:MAG: hypothetical protein MZV64_45340 [Ignavibacteriales bacterium]|nr:hypothetical protein [Ignavibacteriales bacterium]